MLLAPRSTLTGLRAKSKSETNLNYNSSHNLETTPANNTTHVQNIARLQPYTHHCTCLIYFCHGDNYVCMTLWLMLHPWMCAGRFPKSIRFDWTHLGWILPRLWQSRKWRRVTNWFSCTDFITTCTSRGNSWVRYNLLPSILVNNGIIKYAAKIGQALYRHHRGFMVQTNFLPIILNE